MKSSLIIATLFVSLLSSCAVFADTDVCQTTTAEVKVATRTLNMWRAACEDHNWKGSTCYNYWAQLNEVMTLENRLQTCLTRIHQQHSDDLLGSATQTGDFTEDYSASRTLENKLTSDTQTAEGIEGATNRQFVQTTNQNLIDKTKAELVSQSDSTRTTVAQEAKANRDLENQAHTEIRSLQNSNTTRILNTKTTEEKNTRDRVDSQHAQTRTELAAADQSEESTTRDDTGKQQAATRYTEGYETVTVQTLISIEHVATNLTDLSEEKASRDNVAAAETSSRAAVATSTTATANTLAQETAGEKVEINLDDQLVQGTYANESLSTRTSAQQAAAQTRSMFGGLQAALQALYVTEGATQNGMWESLIKILIYFDLQGPRCDKYGETMTFATLSSAGLGRLEQLRGETNITMNYNEAYYGTTKVGRARTYWNSGEVYFRAGDYRSAADAYRLSYQEAVVARS